MFGYVNADKKTMSKEDETVYRAFYCGLCRELFSYGGRKARALLNFDVTFLIILLSGLYEPEESLSDFTCAFHPMKKRTALSNELMHYGAACDMILSYGKLTDDASDDGGSVRKRLLSGIMPSFEKAAREYPRQTQAMKDCVNRTTQAEKSGCTDIEELSDYTGQMLSEIFVMREGDPFEADLRTAGFFLGKYIYLLDCFSDIPSDRKKKRFNPLLLAGGDIFPEGIVKGVGERLYGYIAKCADAFERLPILEYASILRNILYDGVWTRYYLSKNRYEKNGEVS